MELDSKTLLGDLHHALLGFPQAAGSRRPGALLASVTLLAGGSTLAMRVRDSVLRAGLGRRRFRFGSTLGRLDFCGRVLLVSGVAHRRRGVSLVSTL